MQFVRVSTDVWGRQVLEGISWDLLPLAFGIGALVIIGHLIYRHVRRQRRG
jgi:hypothetical protein